MGEIVLVLVLVLAAAVFFAAEICTPIFGLLAGLGLACIAAAVWVGFRLNATFGLVLLIALVVLTPVYLAQLVRVLPKTRFGKRLFLKEARQGAGDATPEADDLKHLVGRRGTAETTLRPSGAVRVGRRRYVARAESDMIEQDTEVMVVRAGGTEVVVRPVAPDGATGGQGAA